MPGGSPFHLLQQYTGSFVVVLDVLVGDAAGTVERHAVALLAGFEVPTHPGHVGCIVDNDPRIPVLMLTAADRATPLAARAVFARLFKTATAVHITSIWKLVALDRP